MQLEKVILITGCTKGIGLATAKVFAKAGYRIIGCARNKNDLTTTAEILLKINPSSNPLLLPCDVSKRTDIDSFLNEVLSKISQIDVLVNNAGVFTPGKLLTEKEGSLENLLNTNVISAYHITRAILPNMIENKTGRVFNICSIASLRAYENGASYTISKFALLGFSKQLRQETIGTGVNVTAIMPGATYTASWDGTNLPKERFIKAEDVANTILSICNLSSDANVDEVIIHPQQGDI